MQDNKASKMFLIVAVVLGVLATVLAFAFINSTAGIDRGPKIRIVVASHDLSANMAIDPDRDLKVIDIPASITGLSNETLDPNALSNYKNQRLNRHIGTQTPVFLSDLSSMGELTLREPYRALTIPAETNLIIPGDYVKIIAAKSGAAGGPNDAELVNGGQAYRVLAVGGSLSKTRSQVTTADQYSSGNVASKTVTLEVTEDQARDIVKAVGPGTQKNILLICPPPPPPAAQQQPAQPETPGPATR